jgi:hypothetical protein
MRQHVEWLGTIRFEISNAKQIAKSKRLAAPGMGGWGLGNGENENRHGAMLDANCAN